MSKFCPCGSEKNYADCCGPYLGGIADAPTPETLMRSRYTAYKKGYIDYLVKTQKDEAAEGFDVEKIKKTSMATQWLELEVVVDFIYDEGHQGLVEFKASYSYRGQKQVLHEISNFRYEQGRWFYVRGVVLQ